MSSAPAMPAAPSSPKRPRLTTLASLAALPIRIEPAGASLVEEMFADGSYLPAEDTRLRQASKGATSFVSRALLGRAEDPDPAAAGAAGAPTGAGAPGTAEDPALAAKEAADANWAGTVVDGVDGALAELGRAISVIEALRDDGPGSNPAGDPVAAAAQNGGAGAGGADGGAKAGGGALLELERYGGRAEQSVGKQKQGGVALMAKRRTLQSNAAFLDERVRGLRAWCKADAEFARALVSVRAQCGGLRRVGGVPLVDVGEGDFVPLERAVDGVAASEDLAPGGDALRLRIGNELSLSFGVATVGEAAAEPAFLVGEGDRLARQLGELSDVCGIVRKIRLARMASFREQTFARIAREAAGGKRTVELTSNCVGFECGPSEVVRVRRTMRYVEDVAAGVAKDSSVEDDAGLLSLVAATKCLHLFSNTTAGESVLRIMDSLEVAAVGVNTLRALETVLDNAAMELRVRVDWSRGRFSQREATARVWAAAVDGDGPSRLLATFDPLSDGNNGGRRHWNGHVRVTPAFGVVIAAPDNPFSRCRSGAHGIHMQSSSSHSQSVAALDDVPRAYICPVGSGEIESVLTLLLCIRLLDALEAAARTGEAAVLDVDRQCFGVIVLAPKTAQVLRAKVWPKGVQPGREKPDMTVWLDEEPLHDFPREGRGRLAAWRLLISQISSNATDGIRDGTGAGAGASNLVGGLNACASGMDVEPADKGSGALPLEGHKNGNGWAHGVEFVHGHNA